MLDYFEKNISGLLKNGNLPHAESLSREWLQREPNNAKAFHFLGLIAAAVNLPEFAFLYFSEAVKLAPDWQVPRLNLEKISKHLAEIKELSVAGGSESKYANSDEKFLLIKAWGFGFWSDVSHILGQLLVAEITGRIPIVHWGSNSLFSDGTSANAFEFYFETFSDKGLADLQNENFDFWPPKWNHRNLAEGEINKWSGPFSRVAGLYLLSRRERVVVSDFHASIFDLKPWIPAGHHLYGLSVDELYLYFVHRYLHPKKVVADAVDSFHEKYLASSDFIAVHARGSDKILEMKQLGDVNKQYQGILDQYLDVHNCSHIFLMTDDSRVLKYFTSLYGNKIITTDCRRTDSETGIHYQSVPDRRQLGIEVMVDAYMAARAKAFVGNGSSNPSLFVRYLKDWPKENAHLLGKNIFTSSQLPSPQFVAGIKPI